MAIERRVVQFLPEPKEVSWVDKKTGEHKSSLSYSFKDDNDVWVSLGFGEPAQKLHQSLEVGKTLTGTYYQNDKGYWNYKPLSEEGQALLVMFAELKQEVNTLKDGKAAAVLGVDEPPHPAETEMPPEPEEAYEDEIRIEDIPF